MLKSCWDTSPHLCFLCACTLRTPATNRTGDIYSRGAHATYAILRSYGGETNCMLGKCFFHFWVELMMTKKHTLISFLCFPVPHAHLLTPLSLDNVPSSACVSDEPVNHTQKTGHKMGRALRSAVNREEAQESSDLTYTCTHTSHRSCHPPPRHDGLDTTSAALLIHRHNGPPHGIPARAQHILHSYAQPVAAQAAH